MENCKKRHFLIQDEAQLVSNATDYFKKFRSLSWEIFVAAVRLTRFSFFENNIEKIQAPCQTAKFCGENSPWVTYVDVLDVKRKGVQLHCHRYRVLVEDWLQEHVKLSQKIYCLGRKFGNDWK